MKVFTVLILALALAFTGALASEEPTTPTASHPTQAKAKYKPVIFARVALVARFESGENATDNLGPRVGATVMLTKRFGLEFDASYVRFNVTTVSDDVSTLHWKHVKQYPTITTSRHRDYIGAIGLVYKFNAK